jgi:hypothetical protein
MEDGTCRSTADVQLVVYVSDSNPFISSFNTVYHLWSDQIIQAQSEKLPGFYMQITFAYWIPLVLLEWSD